MKLLHTSDWHVGRTIRGRSRADEHVAVLAEIVEVARREAVDVVLVAGDVFDTAAPAAQAEQIVYRALLALARTGAEVVVVAGNHDNERRLAAVAPLLRLAGVHVGARLERPDDGGVLTLEPRGGQQVRVALIPWLSQRSIVRADQLMELDADAHAGRYAGRCRSIVEAFTADFDDDAVNVVLAHLTVASGTPVFGGGERAAHTIFDYVVPPQVFPPTAHYVALGHLHRPHRISGRCPIWYSGSPLQLDFGEAAGDKQVLVVEAEPGAPAAVTPVTLGAGRRLVTVSGTLEQLGDRRDEWGDAYLRVVVEEPPRAGLADTVRDLLPHAVDVTVAATAGERPEPEVDLDALRGSPRDLLAEYLAAAGAHDPAVEALFVELWDELEGGGDASDAA